MIIFVYGFSFLLPFLGFDQDVAYATGEYVRVAVFYFFFHQVYDGTRKMLNCLRLYCVHFPVPMVALGVNILANYYFVGQMELGTVGAGLAMLLQGATNVAVIALICLAIRKLRGIMHCISRESFKEWGPIVKMGLQGYIMMFLEYSSYELLTFMSAYISTLHLASNTALINLYALLTMIAYGLQNAMGPQIGNALG